MNLIKKRVYDNVYFFEVIRRRSFLISIWSFKKYAVIYYIVSLEFYTPHFVILTSLSIVTTLSLTSDICNAFLK